MIIDTDPGTDDALAILLALNSPELDVRALTVVPGNVTAKQGLENALKLASLTNRCDIPVAAGAQHPLFQKLITAEFWHGENGLANMELPREQMQSRCALRAGLDHSDGARGAARDHAGADRSADEYRARGAERSFDCSAGEGSGDHGRLDFRRKLNAAAEANIYNDPEAAQIVFQAGWRLTMVGSTWATRRCYDQALGRARQDARPGK